MPSYTITTFGGLNETDPPDEIGLEAAQALNNIAWDNSIGLIRRRYGYSTFVAAESAAFQTLFVHSATRLLGTHSTTLEAYDASGSSVTTQAVASASVSYTNVGTPSTSYTFIADGTNALWSFTGSTIAAGSAAATVDGSGSQAMPKGIHVATDTDSNRLVVCGTASSGGPAGATSSGSHVWFSEPGAPFTWTSTNYVILSPGDNESIVGACTWQGDVYVFKRTKLFIFYGESTDADGNPIFNYRTIDLSNDLRVWGGGGRPICTASRRGVFYVGERGIHLTTGDQPIRVSDELDWGDSEQSSSGVGASVSVAGDKLYIGRNAGSYISDTFIQTSGNLAGKSTDTGETWAGAGDSDDFTIDTSGDTAQRTAVSDSSGNANARFAIAGSGTYTDLAASVDVKFSTTSGSPVLGLLLRYTDTSNYCVVQFNTNSGEIQITPVVSGSGTDITSVSSPFFKLTGYFHRLSVTMSANGGYSIQWGIPSIGAGPVEVLSGQSSNLATGGTLASGKVGLFDHHVNATSVTRNYDNFTASSSSPSALYELDLQTNQWASHDIQTLQAPIAWLDTKTILGEYISKEVVLFDDASYDDDDGTAIDATWTTGISNLGYEGEKALKYVDVWGTGTVGLSIASDYGPAANQETLTLGTGEIARARYTTSAVGTLFGIALAAIDGATFKVHRITLHYDERPDQRSIR